MKLIIYSSTSCPQCQVLKTLMANKHLEYEECHDVDIMQSLGICSIPVLSVDGKLLSFADALKFVNEKVI